MWKNLKGIFIISLLCLLGSNTRLSGHCESINGYPDNGDCDRSQINNKKCIEGGTPECYIPPSGPPIE